jgi:hypothetical protein
LHRPSHCLACCCCRPKSRRARARSCALECADVLFFFTIEPTPCTHTRSPQPRPRVPQHMAKDPVVMPVSLSRRNSSPCFFQPKQATRWSSFFSLLASARSKIQNWASPSSPIKPLRLLPFAPPDYQSPAPLPFFLPVEQINKLQAATLLALREPKFATSLRSCVARTINLPSFPSLFSYALQQQQHSNSLLPLVYLGSQARS